MYDRNSHSHVVQGVPEMAKITGLGERRLRYLIECGLLRGVVQKGRSYFITLANLLSNFQPDGELAIELRAHLDRMSPEELAELLAYWEYCL